MRLSVTLLRLLAVAALTAGFCSCGGGGEEPPRAVNGVIDLRKWDFSSGKSVRLDGQWAFLLDRLSDGSDPGTWEFVPVPGLWNDYLLTTGPVHEYGCGTFRLTILLADTTDPMALLMPDVGTAYVLFVNGRPAARGGRVGTDETTSVPDYNPVTVAIPAGSRRIDLAVQVSNFHHRNGGLWETVRFGREEDIRRERERDIAADLFLFGSILIMGLYHLGLFAFYRRDRSPLYFAAVCFLFALRVLVTGQYYFITLFPGLSWAAVMRIEYLTFYLGVVFFITFLHSLFSERFPRAVLRVFQVLGGLFCCAVVVLPPALFSHTVRPYEAFTIAACLYAVYVIIASMRIKPFESAVFLPGFILLFGMAVNDILHHNLVINTGYLVPLGLFLFIFSQAVFLAFRFSRTIREHGKARFKLLQERVNPHFLFNALNAIHSIVRKDPDLADGAIIRLADMYRYLTEQTQKTMVPFDEEWEFMKNYLSLEKLRFGDTLQYSMEREGDFREISLPPLTIQPLAENAVKHGIKNKEGGGRVFVRAERKAELVTVTVEDDGVGLKDGAALKGASLFSRTLGNIRLRLSHEFFHADLQAHNRKEGGARITVTFRAEKSGRKSDGGK